RRKVAAEAECADGDASAVARLKVSQRAVLSAVLERMLPGQLRQFILEIVVIRPLLQPRAAPESNHPIAADREEPARERIDEGSRIAELGRIESSQFAARIVLAEVRGPAA